MRNVEFFDHAVHCEWNDWETGDCSTDCGGGIRTNSRTRKVVALHGGDKCNGDALSIQSCNTQPCPGMISFKKNSFLYRFISIMILFHSDQIKFSFHNR